MLFNERVGLCAAAVFAVAQSTLFLGNFATYDPPAIVLLALASWLAVRTARAGTLLASALVAPVLALAIAVKYASGLYLPTVVGLTVLAAYYSGGGPRSARSASPHWWPACSVPRWPAAVAATSPASRAPRPAARKAPTARWNCCSTRCAGRGRCCCSRSSAPSSTSGGSGWGSCRPPPAAPPGSRRAETVGRLLLGALLSATALLAPAYQMHLHTGTSLHKHVGFGLLFAAPHGRCRDEPTRGSPLPATELAIVAWVAVLVLGLAQSDDRYHVWPDTTALIATLRPQLGPNHHYLVGANWVPQYYLRVDSRPDQWTSTYSISYTDRRGRHLSGDAGYRAAIGDSYFDVVVLDPAGGRIDRALGRQLRADANYRLLAALPYRKSTGGAFYRVAYVTGSYQVWVRATASR